MLLFTCGRFAIGLNHDLQLRLVVRVLLHPERRARRHLTTAQTFRSESVRSAVGKHENNDKRSCQNIRTGSLSKQLSICSSNESIDQASKSETHVAGEEASELLALEVALLGVVAPEGTGEVDGFLSSSPSVTPSGAWQASERASN